jgi:hypothetical protein
MSTTPLTGSGTWIAPADTRTVQTLLDQFQAHSIVREQNVLELTRAYTVIKDTYEKFKSNQLSPADSIVIIAEFKSDQFTAQHQDSITQLHLLALITKFEEEANYV